MKYLITGASGFIGWHLSRYFVHHGQRVGLLDKNPLTNPAEFQGLAEMFIGDITDTHFVKEVILKYNPNVIFHLAAQSLPRVSWNQPVMTMQVNIIGTLNILEVLREYNLETKIIIFGSSSEYKQNQYGYPISEKDILEASSPYAISKLAIDNLSILYSKTYNTNVLIVRPFFVIGPKKENDVCSDFAREIVKVELNQQSCIRVGNLEIIRDFIDVRDAIHAIHIISEKGNLGEIYNICTGKGHSINEILKIYSKIARKSFDIENDLSLLRPLDEKIKIGNPEKIKKLGWVQQHSIEETLQKILNYWRHK